MCILYFIRTFVGDDREQAVNIFTNNAFTRLVYDLLHAPLMHTSKCGCSLKSELDVHWKSNTVDKSEVLE